MRPLLCIVAIFVVAALTWPHGNPIRAQGNGLVAAYGFEEVTGGQAVDASGGGHGGTIAGATRTTSGRFGSALVFDGINDWVTVADQQALDLTTGMTLEAWVYPTALSGWRAAMVKETTSGLAYGLYAHDNAGPGTYINTGTEVEAFGTAPLPLNAWSHLAATYDGATLRLYVNATLVGSLVHAGSMVTSSSPLRIGGNAVWGEFLQGRIDEIRVYNRPLGQAEIQQDMGRPVVQTDTSAPTVTSTSPANGAANVLTGTNVSVLFSEAMNPATISSATVTLRDEAQGLVPATVTYDVTSQTATLDPSSRLEPTATYTARVVSGSTGVKDVADNSMAADVVWTFTTTADTDTPIVVSRSPAPGATNVSTAVSVTATFNEPMQGGSISFVLRSPVGMIVPATVTYEDSSLTATLRPAVALAASTSYTATVEGAADLVGNPMAAPVTWSFSTGASGFQESIVFSDLVEPTAVDFASDGRVFVAEKSGLIKVFDSLTDTTPTIFADLRTNVHNFLDRGILGIAVDPQFPARPYIYVLYTYDAAIGGAAPRWGTVNGTSDQCPNPPGTGNGCVVSGRLSRLEVSAGNVQVGPERVLIEDWGQQFDSHSIGHIAFDSAGALYASGGDGASYLFVDYGQSGSPLNPLGDPPVAVGGTQTPPTAEGGALRSQDLRTSTDPVGLNGTIVRVDPDTGQGLPDNPLSGNPDPNAKRIIAYGMRNPFRFAIRPGTQELYVGDVGWNDWEEINRIGDTADAMVDNFGWPCYEGAGRQGGYDGANLNICENLYNQPSAVTAPFYAYDRNSSVVPGESCPTGSSSISGLAFYAGGNYPASFQSALFFADYSRGCIWVMYSDASGLPNPATIATFRSDILPVDLKIGPGGDLFFVDISGSIRRIRYFDWNRPPLASATATPMSGVAPMTVDFDGSASSDPDVGDTLRYAWDLDGDGFFDDGSSATVSFTYTAAGVYSARLQVTDSQGLSDIELLVITTNSLPPDATMQTPTSSLTWRVADLIDFSGVATDPEDGDLSPSALSWSLTLQHCFDQDTCHAHQIQTFAGVSSGSFVAPDHEYPSYLELTLTATDSSGLTDTERVRLDPQTVALTFDSIPSGLTLIVGSGGALTPFQKTVIVGSTNSISAPSPQAVGATSYEFVSWSDGGANAHEITAPAAASSYVATYATVPSISITDEVTTEEDGPGVTLSFTVTLSTASTRTVTVDYTTTNGTATSGSDYTATAGTLSFPGGMTSQSIVVLVGGDTLDEANETFTVTLTNPAHAALADAQGVGTIVDNDPPPSIAVGDIEVLEGSSGTTNATFTVTLSAASGLPVTVNYATANGTASAGPDYVGKSGTLNFAPGTTSASVAVLVQGDVIDEPDETFNLNLTGPVNATLADAQAVALLRDDDVPVAGGLVAAYGFEETSGLQVSDASGRGHTGTISGATRTASGRFGRALSFDGINDWVTVADTAALDLTTGMTLEAWVYPTLLSGWRSAMLKAQPGGLAYALYAHDNVPRPAAYINTGSELSAIGTAALPLNAWSHLASTYDGSTLRFYVNGALVGTRVAPGSIVTSTSPLRMGGNAVWGEWFRGRLDEVRVYDRPLSQAEIQQDMLTALAGN